MDTQVENSRQSHSAVSGRKLHQESAVPVNKALTVYTILAKPHMGGQHYCSTGPASSQSPSQIHTLVMKRPRSSNICSQLCLKASTSSWCSGGSASGVAGARRADLAGAERSKRSAASGAPVSS
jgi:hypothetical protein